MYSLVLALVLISMDRYLAALERGGWFRWLLYVVSTGMAVYVHLVAALMIPVQLLAFFLTAADTRRARWKGWLVSIGVLLLPYLPLLRWQLPLVLNRAETGYQFVPLHDMLVSLLTNYSLGLNSGGLRWAVFFFLVLLFAAGWLERRQRSRLASLGILGCWLLIPVLGFFLLTLVRPMYTARYLIFLLPAYLILIAAGVVAIGARARLVAAVLLAALLVVNFLGLWRQGRTPIKADFRSATEYVASRWASDDLLIFQIPYGRHSFDYYLSRYSERYRTHLPGEVVTPRPSMDHRVYLPLMARQGAALYRWAEGLYTNGGMDPGLAFSAMEERTAEASTVWFIATEVEMWDERALVQTWLEQHALLTDQAHFVRVSVYRFSFP